VSDDRRPAADATAPLTHADAEALISARLDGPLDPVMNRALLAHLATCDSCRAFANDMDVMATAFRDFPSLPPSTAVTRRVRAEIRAGGSPVRRFTRWVTTSRAAPMTALGGAAVALALVTASVFGTLRDDNDNNPSVGAPNVAMNQTATKSAEDSALVVPTQTIETGGERFAPLPTATNPTNVTAPTQEPTQESAAPTEEPSDTNDGGAPQAADSGVTKEASGDEESAAPTEAAETSTEPAGEPTTDSGEASGDENEEAPTAEPTRGGPSAAFGAASEQESPESALTPTAEPTEEPTSTPQPTETPTEEPTSTPEPTETPTEEPTSTPEPTETPTEEPTSTPAPTETPIPEPTETPTAEPTSTPTEEPPATETPTPQPTPTEETSAASIASGASTPESSTTLAEEPTPSPTPEIATPTPEPPTPTPNIVPVDGQPSDDESIGGTDQEAQPTEAATEEPEQPAAVDGQGSDGESESPPIVPSDGSQPSDDTTAVEDLTPEGNETIGETNGTLDEASTPESEGQGGEAATEEATEEPTEEATKPSGPLSFADLASANYSVQTYGSYIPGPGGFAAETFGTLSIVDANGAVLTSAWGYNPIWASDGTLYAADSGLTEGSGSALIQWVPGGSSPAAYITDGTYRDTPAGEGSGGFYFVRWLPDAGSVELHVIGQDDPIWTYNANLVSLSAYIYGDVVYIPTDQGWLAVTTGGEVIQLGTAVGYTYDLVLDQNSGQIAYVDGNGTVYVAPASDPSAASNAGSIGGNGGIAWTPYGLAIASGSEVTIGGTSVVTNGGDLGAPVWTGSGLTVADAGAGGEARVIDDAQIQQALGQ
jgi:hypothetical protein